MKQIISAMQLSKLKLFFTGLASVFFLTSACHCDESQDMVASNKVLLLKLSYGDHTLQGGKEYQYFNTSDTFTLVAEEVAAQEEKMVSLVYKELNAVLFKGVYPFASGTTQILLPEKFIPAADFERVLTQDVVNPLNGYRELSGTHMNDALFGNLWTRIQNLVKVREYLRENPGQQVQVYLHKPVTGTLTPDNTHWFFFLKN